MAANTVVGDSSYWLKTNSISPGSADSGRLVPSLYFFGPGYQLTCVSTSGTSLSGYTRVNWERRL